MTPCSAGTIVMYAMTSVGVYKSFIPWLVRAPNKKRKRTRDYTKSLIEERYELELKWSSDNSIVRIECPLCHVDNCFPKIRDVTVGEFFNPLYSDLAVSKSRMRAIIRSARTMVPGRHNCFACGCNFNTLILDNDVFYCKSQEGSKYVFYLRSGNRVVCSEVSSTVFDNHVCEGTLNKLLHVVGGNLATSLLKGKYHD